MPERSFEDHGARVRARVGDAVFWAAIWAVSALALAYLLLPTLIIVGASFTTSDTFTARLERASTRASLRGSKRTLAPFNRLPSELRRSPQRRTSGPMADDVPL